MFKRKAKQVINIKKRVQSLQVGKKRTSSKYLDLRYLSYLKLATGNKDLK